MELMQWTTIHLPELRTAELSTKHEFLGSSQVVDPNVDHQSSTVRIAI